MSDRQTQLPSVEETLIQLNDLMSAGIREAPVKSPLGPVHSACQMAVKVLGLPTQPSRGGVKSDSSVEDIAASVGLSARAITLTGNWWEADHGLFIGTLLEEEKQEPKAVSDPTDSDRSQEAPEEPQAEEEKGHTVLVRSSKGLTPLEFCMVGQSGACATTRMHCSLCCPIPHCHLATFSKGRFACIVLKSQCIFC